MAYQSKYTGLQIDDILDSVEWKQGKIEDLASIRAGAQKGATALQSYTEKYTGTVTGIKINGVVKSGSGVIDLGIISTTETDPIFSASPAASITEAKKAEWDNKVDKVSGKQLSTEDFTTALKTKLEGLSNYDDTELSDAIETLRGDFDNIVSGDTTTAIKTFNEVIAFLDGLTDTQDLESIIASIEQQIAGKMDTLISGTNIKTINGESILGSGDLTIESGAKVYEWFLDSESDSVTLSQEEYDNIVEADIVVVNIGGMWSCVVNKTDKEFSEAVGNYALNGQFDMQEGTFFIIRIVINISTKLATITLTLQEIPTKTSQLENDSNFITSEDVAAVALSGSYNDLSNKPTIPSAVTESTVSGWGFTKNAGTVTGVKINGTTKSPTSGVVDLGTVITDISNFATKDEVVLKDTTGELVTAQTQALYGGGLVYALPDQANGDEDDILLSQRSVKTINGQSIVGKGDITISGGSGGGSSAYSEVNHGTSDTTFTLTPNTFHVWDEVSALTLTLGSETSGVANEYLFQFTSGATATSLSLPSDLKWANDSAPTIAENMIYQVSILKGLASVLEFSNAPSLIENKVTVSISGTKYLVSLQYAAASDIVVKVRTVDGPISVNILSGETSKTASPAGPMIDSSAYIESITPAVDNNYTYIW